MVDRRHIRIFAGLAILLGQATPAFAGAADRVSFQIAPKVVSQVLERVDGETKLLVASNSAFNISATGMIGTIKVMIEKDGQTGGTQFGSASQLPGQKTAEIFLTSPLETQIYRSDRKTALNPGNTIDQAVLVRITYSSTTHPILIIEPEI